jgi:hypothetical protein
MANKESVTALNLKWLYVKEIPEQTNKFKVSKKIMTGGKQWKPLTMEEFSK